MEKAMVFSFEEFDSLITKVTYGVMGFVYNTFDGYHFVETMNDDDWDEWIKEFGEEAENEINNFEDDYELVYSMIGKKFNMIVKSIIADAFMDAVVIIFE